MHYCDQVAACENDEVDDDQDPHETAPHRVFEIEQVAGLTRVPGGLPDGLLAEVLRQFSCQDDEHKYGSGGKPRPRCKVRRTAKGAIDP